MNSRWINSQWVTRMVVALMSTTLFFFLACNVGAQTYPSKLIRCIIPYGAGTSIDVVTRIVAQKMAENWGNPIVIDNRSGAAGAIGMEMAARAAPDGHTIVIGSPTELLNQFMIKSRYDIFKDFAPVSLMGLTRTVMAVTPSLSAHSVDELVALARAKPGQMNYAAAPGSRPHLLAEMLKAARGIDIVHIPYKSSTDAVADVVSGRVEMLFTPLATALPLAKTGKLRVLAVSGGKRVPVLPDVPTLGEVGLLSLDTGAGLFVLAPAGTPGPIINALRSEVVKAMESREVVERLAAIGVAPASSTPEALGALLKSEAAMWGKVIADAGLTAK